MKEFNYQDYLKYCKLKIKEYNGMSQICDVEEKYNIHQPHDKLFKIVLEEKKQVVELLNKILNLDIKIKESDIEKYKNEYINNMFQSRKADIVYKMKEKDIFFLIEHQSKIDYNMPVRILEYEVEIIREAIRGRNMTKENHILPSVIPIVIYTGNKKWNVEKYIEECQEKLTKSDRIKLGEYYVLDINDFNKEEQRDSLFLLKIFLLEKAETEAEIIDILNNILITEKMKGKEELIKKIITYIINEKIEPENREKILKKLNKEDKNMIAEVLKKENARQRKIGREQGIKQGMKQGMKQTSENIIIKMLNFKIDEDIICKVTGVDKEQIEKIKKKVK